MHDPWNLGLTADYHRALAEARASYFAFVPDDREESMKSFGNVLAAVGSADRVVQYHAKAEAQTWPHRPLIRLSPAFINFLFGLRLRYYHDPCVYTTAFIRSLRTTTIGLFLADMLVLVLRRGHTYVEGGLIHQERVRLPQSISVTNIFRTLTTLLPVWWVPAVSSPHMEHGA